MENELKKIEGIKNFAILGGTFDPIHNGHISIAKEVLETTNVEKIIFIPTGNPPHKDANEVTDSKHRLKMTMLAVENLGNMEVSSIEVDREGITYTVDTVEYLKHTLGEEVSFKFITGADAIHYVSTWKDYKKLLSICSFIVVTRPGYNKKNLEKQVAQMKEDFGCDVDFIETTPVDISSSEIREALKLGKSLDGLLPKAVEDYIIEEKLYTNNE